MLTPYSHAQGMSHETFFSKVLNLFGLTLLLGGAGAWVSWRWSPAIFLPAVIAEFVFLLAVIFIRKNQEIRGLLLALFCLTSGITLVPLLQGAVHAGGIAIIMNALAVTGLVFLALSAYAVKSGKDFSFLGGFLFAALLGLMGIGLLSMLFHWQLPVLAYSFGGVLIFSGFVLYDMSNVMRRYSDDQTVDAALALYLDFLNLFVLILSIFMNFSNRSRD